MGPTPGSSARRCWRPSSGTSSACLGSLARRSPRPAGRSSSARRGSSGFCRCAGVRRRAGAQGRPLGFVGVPGLVGAPCQGLSARRCTRLAGEATSACRGFVHLSLGPVGVLLGRQGLSARRSPSPMARRVHRRAGSRGRSAGGCWRAGVRRRARIPVRPKTARGFAGTPARVSSRPAGFRRRAGIR